MLEIKDLCKTYKPKRGEAVKALDSVSVSFPERGMVFILGKSGSGKSTLLNVMGGLDSADSGEFIIKGKSSKDFGGSDFDAYRNTFIGFIFQEYNMLEEFSVGANIALALELQGKKATNDKINQILREVDLDNHASRKPNELSGGQKQRVAIARALVKDPEIIMADEPTGALDSNTGKQIFDTLKKLSETKLVIVVSHDREFSEKYADRIIELKDGKIISDVSCHVEDSRKIGDGIEQVGEDYICIRKGYTLTENDIRMINEYLSTNNSDIFLSKNEKVNAELKNTAGISNEAGKGRKSFSDTTDGDVEIHEYDPSKTKFIRSRLPFRNAFKMGKSGLKYKKFRLVMTIFLSVIAFTLFGLSDTMAAWNHSRASVTSIMDAGVRNASFALNIKETNNYYRDGKLVSSYDLWEPVSLNSEDIKTLEKETGLEFYPVYGSNLYGSSKWIDFTGSMTDPSKLSTENGLPMFDGSAYGYVKCDAKMINDLGFNVYGSLPKLENEIAIPEFFYRQYTYTGFKYDENGVEKTVEGEKLTHDPDGSEDSIIGKYITFRGNNGNTHKMKVTAVIDTHFDYDRYGVFMPGYVANGDENGILTLLLQMELGDVLGYGFHGLLFYGEAAEASILVPIENDKFSGGEYINGLTANFYLAGNPDKIASAYSAAKMSDVGHFDVFRFDGKDSKTPYAENDAVIPYDSCYQILSASNIEPSEELTEIFNGLGMAQEDSLEKFNAYFGTSFDNIEMFYDIQYPEDLATFRNMLEQLFVFDDALSYYKSHSKDDPLIKNFLTEMGIGEESAEESETLIRFAKYYEYYCYGNHYIANYFGRSQKEVMAEANRLCFEMLLKNNEGILDNINVRLEGWDKNNDTVNVEIGEYNIVGYYISKISPYEYYDTVFSDALYEECLRINREWSGSEEYFETIIAEHEPGPYSYAITNMPTQRSGVRKLVDLHYSENDGYNFEMRNEVMYAVDNFGEVIDILAVVFLYIGLGFAVFASLMLANFIAISISYKKKEIGILRAVGARGSDVYMIFFFESLIIAMINFVLSVAGTILLSNGINSLMRGDLGFKITMLSFGVRQFLLLFAISVFVAAVASFIPVQKFARKKPIDAIKGN